MTREQIIEAIKAMTVLELNELVKACEEEFGVSAAAPVAVVGAAGAAEAVAAVLALKNGEVPPTVHLDEVDPECDLDYTPNVSVKAELTMALSISLGFGGHNGCLAFRKI